jgi:hypothetical protein
MEDKRNNLIEIYFILSIFWKRGLILGQSIIAVQFLILDTRIVIFNNFVCVFSSKVVNLHSEFQK